MPLDTRDPVQRDLENSMQDTYPAKFILPWTDYWSFWFYALNKLGTVSDVLNPTFARWIYLSQNYDGTKRSFRRWVDLLYNQERLQKLPIDNFLALYISETTGNTFSFAAATEREVHEHNFRILDTIWIWIKTSPESIIERMDDDQFHRIK